MLRQLKLPLVALALGVVPFFLFLGISQTLTVNGAVVHDDQLNIGGLVLAGVGFMLALRSVRPVRQRARATLAVLAAVVCAVQLSVSAGVVPRYSLIDWLVPDDGLPELTYSGLDEANRGIPEGILARSDAAELRRSIVNYTAYMLMDVNLHVDYADMCHDGRYRLDVEAMRVLPDVLTDPDRQEIAARVAADRRALPDACSDRLRDYRMGEIVDAARQKRDIIDVLVAGYRERFR